jgi:hypothetical protein
LVLPHGTQPSKPSSVYKNSILLIFFEAPFFSRATKLKRQRANFNLLVHC